MSKADLLIKIVFKIDAPFVFVPLGEDLTAKSHVKPLQQPSMSRDKSRYTDSKLCDMNCVQSFHPCHLSIDISICQQILRGQ